MFTCQITPMISWLNLFPCQANFQCFLNSPTVYQRLSSSPFLHQATNIASLFPKRFICRFGCLTFDVNPYVLNLYIPRVVSDNFRNPFVSLSPSFCLLFSLSSFLPSCFPSFPNPNKRYVSRMSESGGRRNGSRSRKVQAGSSFRPIIHQPWRWLQQTDRRRRDCRNHSS